MEESTYLDEQTIVKKSEYKSIKEKMKIIKNNALLTRSNFDEQIQLYKKAEQNMNILKEHIVCMDSKSTQELIDLGYNSNQLDAIRNYDYLDQMTVRASGYVSSSVYISSYYQQNNHTYLTVIFDGNYNGAFSQQFRDNIGVSVVCSGANFYATSYDCTTVYAVSIRIMRSFSVSYSAVADGAVIVFQYRASYVHNYYSIGLGGLSISANGSIEYESRIIYY